MRRDRGDLAGVVALVATDRDEGVGALGEDVGDDVLELARLVAAEGEAAVALLALGPELDLVAERCAEALERMDRRRTESQGMAGVAAQVQGVSDRSRAGTKS